MTDDTALVALPTLRVALHPAARMSELAAWPSTEAAARDALGRVTGIVPAEAPGRTAGDANGQVMTLARRRWLVVHRTGDGGPDALRAAVDATIGAVFDLSAARAGFHLSGAHALTLASKLAPVDFDLPRHAPGCVVQTGEAHGIGRLLCRDAPRTFRLFVERSHAGAMADRLRAEAAEFGPAPT